MEKYTMKGIFTVSVLVIWYFLYKICMYVFDNLPIAENYVLAINICFIFGIFIILLPLSIFITHSMFTHIKRNY